MYDGWEKTSSKFWVFFSVPFLAKFHAENPVSSYLIGDRPICHNYNFVLHAENNMSIFLSVPDAQPRFEEDEHLRERLNELCKNWKKYLLQHLSSTHKLFGSPEFPWKMNERVLVSTFAASIMRSSKQALISEELPVPKKITLSTNGRCDLWAHIPVKDESEPFSFYLEAKKFRKDRRIDEIDKALTGKYGIQRMFSDYVKSHGTERIYQKSSYSNLINRRHTHYVIGMIGLPIIGGEKADKDVHEKFNVFSKKQFAVDGKVRRMSRYPTAGLYVHHPEFPSNALLATLTVLGSSKG